MPFLENSKNRNDQALEYCEMAIEKKNNYSKAYEMLPKHKQKQLQKETKSE